MKLEDIINIYNSTRGSSLVLLRKQNNPSSFAKGLKEQIIEIIDYSTSSTVYSVKETSIKDVTESLEERVVAWLFDEGTKKE